MQRQQWEYRVMTTKSNWRPFTDDEIQDALNKLGQRGWEAVNVSPHPGSGGTKFVFVLKRPAKVSHKQQRMAAAGNGRPTP